MRECLARAAELCRKALESPPSSHVRRGRSLLDLSILCSTPKLRVVLKPPRPTTPLSHDPSTCVQFFFFCTPKLPQLTTSANQAHNFVCWRRLAYLAHRNTAYLLADLRLLSQLGTCVYRPITITANSLRDAQADPFPTDRSRPV